MDYRLPEPSLPEDDWTPPTEPKGALVPPPRVPPTAVSAAAAGPEPRPPRAVRSWAPTRRRSRFKRAVRAAFELLDGVADGIRAIAKSAGSVMASRRPN